MEEAERLDYTKAGSVKPVPSEGFPSGPNRYQEHVVGRRPLNHEA